MSKNKLRMTANRFFLEDGLELKNGDNLGLNEVKIYVSTGEEFSLKRQSKHSADANINGNQGNLSVYLYFSLFVCLTVGMYEADDLLDLQTATNSQ